MKIPRFPFLFTLRRQLASALLLAGTATLPLSAGAGLISSVTVGPDTAPYTYNLTVEFANSNYYDFVLRSTATSLTGEALINTVASYPAANMTLFQQAFSFGSAVNRITIGSDTAGSDTSAGGYDPATGRFWAYWNGSATVPVQWTSPQEFGESGRTITPGQADGWVYSTGANAPQAMSFAVPEPSTWALLAVASAGLVAPALRRRTVPTVPAVA